MIASITASNAIEGVIVDPDRAIKIAAGIDRNQAFVAKLVEYEADRRDADTW